MKTGILGGSFNPPHYGHLALARAALRTGEIESIVFIPARTPPHKTLAAAVPSRMRLEMTLLLAGEDARASVDDLELKREGPSYTIDTVRDLYRRFPENSYRLVIGSDMALMFSKWREHRELLRLAPPLVAERPDAVLGKDVSAAAMFPDSAGDEAETLYRGLFPMEPVAINSTLVRERIGAGAGEEELRGYMPGAIVRYIRAHGLYGMNLPL